ncbi:FAD-dependent oxidoreductase [Reichenbachiella carrageenanivorans]|uniref:FAD-dependent oxidoreductase n=1 Tax=Reichenbachiella carrageenanivorans TaxID=2979869 RepID=A0ABY6CVE3_9BACT|nr:FAD-dependent oxidoreductase [Reichenbachiella carrageenanivorans]UXX77866.1 FAD-dependent oxidoreductase [Reichenbachiella carrageenanivorans]
MIQKGFNKGVRVSHEERIETDLVIIGGGIAGVCAAITAARKGTKVALVQDRPVLGGNASSEVRLWILGATSHMGNNNRWSREGGVMDEILVENMYKNKEGNAIVFDTILLDKVYLEPNIQLFLNTAVYEVAKKEERKIQSVRAFNPQNSTQYLFVAPLFCDASGDGIVAFQAGAAFRMGAETEEEFGELFTPDESYGELLGHSMYFYSKSTDQPVKYRRPSYALKDIKEIPRYKLISKTDMGCRFWWFEYGGRADTIHQTEEIKWELWKVIYGVWDYIKNSGEFEDVDHLTLEWVATVPGKRESRRFEGLYMIKQQDVIEQRNFPDAVAHGGWALDLHPSDGIYSDQSGCTQWHAKGVYEIPYRSFVSKDIDNLFLAGRIISATHVAFGSTRVMATCGNGGQAVGMAAALCIREGLLPKDMQEEPRMTMLQNELNLVGQSIPHVPIRSEQNLINDAVLKASSVLKLGQMPAGDTWINLATSLAQLLPLSVGQAYHFRVNVKAKEKTTLTVQLRISEKPANYTPEIIWEELTFELAPGQQSLEIAFSKPLENSQYAFLTFLSNEKVEMEESDHQYSGILTVYNGENKAVSNTGKQSPPDGIGIDTFEFWTPKRRPEGKNLALQSTPEIVFDSKNLGNGLTRPWLKPNAWVAELKDEKPKLHIEWEQTQKISEIRLFWDTDYDHAMESTLMGHPEEVMPFCVRNYKITTLTGEVLAAVEDNYQTLHVISLEKKVNTKGIVLEMEHPSQHVPAALFEIIVR